MDLIHESLYQDSENSISATGVYPQLSRSISAASTNSLFSTDTSSSTGRDSLGSTASSIDTSHSSASGRKFRQSYGGSNEKPHRRGYVRPQGTNFAASAKSRESVLSLGSITHLQYYFARTGLLDGKGGRLARGKGNRGTLDLAALDTSFIPSTNPAFDGDSSYASMGSSPEIYTASGEVPVGDMTQEDEEYFSGEDDEDYAHILPPTVSTYNYREKPIPRPPTLEELKTELEKTLANAVEVLEELKRDPTSIPASSPIRKSSSEADDKTITKDERGWYEIQGMHVLDIMTLAIRAAKMYYTAHEQPTRLAAIKPERMIRSELLSVMEVLRKMATRGFGSGVRLDERETMEQWVASIYEMLHQEEAIVDLERKQRASWSWLDDSWECSEVERELAFIKSMDPDSHNIPPFISIDDVSDHELPTEFLRDFMTGLRLVKLHNVVVKKSKRPFGAIEKWHTDFRKPYRCTENLKYWIKAAELRFEVLLDVDVEGVVNDGTDRVAWKKLEDAIWKWCKTVRQEISAELRS
ncbi:hypothetical protein K3495_g11270 [Podosphaera aphanis]|nr:hypothetical protein K3495_g11270 [Podosphaera aphanis]